MSSEKNSGKLEVITGCMFAGKTEELLKRLRRAEISGQEVEIFTPEIDDRYEREKIQSHNGNGWEAQVVTTDEEGIETISKSEADVLAIDEFNFFNKSFIETVQQKADEGKKVILSGLDQDFKAEAFSPMDTALAVADDVVKLSAVCEGCGADATRTQRIIDGEPAHEDDPQVVVGSDEKYEARCRNCHTVRRG